MSEEYDGYLIACAENELDKLDCDSNPARGPVDQVWRAVAGGTLPQPDMAEWAKIIAKRVVAQVLDERTIADERPRQALRALGLFGRIDENYREQKMLELFVGFEPLCAIDPENRVSRNTKILNFMRAQGFYGDLSPKLAKARIERLLQKIPPTG